MAIHAMNSWQGWPVAAAVALVAAHSMFACGGGDEKQAPPPDAGTPDSSPAFIVDGGGEAATAPNGEAQCKTGPCNYQTQQGCGEEQSCMPELRNGAVAPSCQRAGTAQRGDPCTGWNDCATGLFCAEKVCRKLCCGGDWSACPMGESCIRQLLVHDEQSSTNIPAGADLCFPVGTCNVLDPQACSDTPGRNCQIVDPLGNVACAPNGSVELGQACGGGRVCAAGLFCAGETCRKLCGAVAGLTVACPAGQGQCVHFTRDPAGVGECTP